MKNKGHESIIAQLNGLQLKAYQCPLLLSFCSAQKSLECN